MYVYLNVCAYVSMNIDSICTPSASLSVGIRQCRDNLYIISGQCDLPAYLTCLCKTTYPEIVHRLITCTTRRLVGLDLAVYN